MPETPDQVLERLYAKVEPAQETPIVKDTEVLNRIEYVARCPSNRAGVRLVMACMLGKIDRPEVDPRNPYTEIGGDSSFSGRTYDERYITNFINSKRLPCNSTTAFLTPALRNIDSTLTTDLNIVGRPAQLYRDALQILGGVANELVTAEDVLADTIRILCAVRDERRQRMETLLAGIAEGQGGLPLSSGEVVTLIEQHLACRNASRLPVLVVAAAYQAVQDKIGETVKPLLAHNAADEQTGAIGDVEVLVANDDQVVTSYEMKLKRVTIDDINRAVTKINAHAPKIDNYIFITTDPIDQEVSDYARSMYEKLGGVEIVVLDCIGFVRHFLHFFHRSRIEFLEAYQRLVLAEPDSAVSQPLKEAFLSLRQAAESDE